MWTIVYVVSWTWSDQKFWTLQRAHLRSILGTASRENRVFLGGVGLGCWFGLGGMGSVGGWWCDVGGRAWNPLGSRLTLDALDGCVFSGIGTDTDFGCYCACHSRCRLILLGPTFWVTTYFVLWVLRFVRRKPTIGEGGGGNGNGVLWWSLCVPSKVKDYSLPLVHSNIVACMVWVLWNY